MAEKEMIELIQRTSSEFVNIILEENNQLKKDKENLIILCKSLQEENSKLKSKNKFKRGKT